jgi:hypothetical protein
MRLSNAARSLRMLRPIAFGVPTTQSAAYASWTHWFWGSTFDAALMQAIRQPFPLVTRNSPSVVASGMIPPDRFNP